MKKFGEAVISVCYLLAMGAACYGAYVVLSAQRADDDALLARGVMTMVGAVIGLGFLWYATGSLKQIVHLADVHAAVLKRAHRFVCPTCGHSVYRITYRQLQPRCARCGSHMAAV